ncbi:MAG: hypothetical protein ACR2P0_14465 [Acidimicrobiales bacterium]
MIRGALSFVGLIIMAVLLLGAVQGRMSIGDVASRGVVIVVAIAVVDKIVAPVLSMGIQATTPKNDKTLPFDAPIDPGE